MGVVCGYQKCRQNLKRFYLKIASIIHTFRTWCNNYKTHERLLYGTEWPGSIPGGESYSRSKRNIQLLFIQINQSQISYYDGACTVTQRELCDINFGQDNSSTFLCLERGMIPRVSSATSGLLCYIGFPLLHRFYEWSGSKCTYLPCGWFK